MSILKSFRTGWENENLARFILSKVAFVSQPVSVSDDLGSDFFCTLFDLELKDGHTFMRPRNSFAIQIKSNAEPIDISNKLDYYINLELPFFVGVVKQKELSLAVYSGEYVPVFFPYRGVPKQLELELCDRINSVSDYERPATDGLHTIRCPLLFEIGASASQDELQKAREDLSRISLEVLANISTRHSGATLYEFSRVNQELVVAGTASTTVFRRNFMKRLAEVIFNLSYLIQQEAPPELVDEAQFFLNLHDELVKRGLPGPAVMPGLVDQLRDLLATVEAGG